MHRRDFLRTSLAGAGALTALHSTGAAARERTVAFVIDPADHVASSAAAGGALGHLRRSLRDAGIPSTTHERLNLVSAGTFCIVCSDIAMPLAAAVMRDACVSVTTGPERVVMTRGWANARDVLLVGGSDASGLTYGLLDLADRVRGGDPWGALDIAQPVAQSPANAVRSVMRQFTSDVLDKPWFNDRQMWSAYLTMIASHRFNRLHLAFGLGYDMLQRVTDSYFLFLYPFLVDVPGYQVRVTNLSDAERDANLAMLRWISEQTVARGLQFQLGIWMHGYALIDSPNANHTVTGLTAATHAAYCRDALATVLRACPAISAVALRIHGESGIAEGSYDFWQTVFDGVKQSGRRVEIDLHAKGLDHQMIGRALATGMPVNVSPKYWAEHLGMPYHQAAIRALEMPVEGHTGNGLMTLSEGSLSFTRYGYADFLRDDRRYTVRHRMFAGTQRLLLSGDLETGAAYGRAFRFCGSAGMDLMEPLTCRGRRGTGVAGQRRSGYIDGRLEPRWDWQKYGEWYRTWGRLSYDPNANASQVGTDLGSDAKGRALASALARASRVLPIVTTAYTPSAACDAYWPEIYWNQPIVAEPRPNPYGDTIAPKTFSNASPLDPQLFSNMNACASELLSNRRSGRYSPIEVAQWLEDLAAAIDKDLAAAGRPATPDAERTVLDVRLQAGLARFFGAKFRAGVLYAVSEQAKSRKALEASLERYRAARAAWSELADLARPVYVPELASSDKLSARGHWSDRLPAIDADVERLAQAIPLASGDGDAEAAAAIAEARGRVERQPVECTHRTPDGFRPNAEVPLRLQVAGGRSASSVRCYYRHVNQAERFVPIDMPATDGVHAASIPAAYSDSPYPLQYYFVVDEGTRNAALYPGLGAKRLEQPYFVLHRL